MASDGDSLLPHDLGLRLDLVATAIASELAGRGGDMVAVGTNGGDVMFNAWATGCKMPFLRTKQV